MKHPYFIRAGLHQLPPFEAGQKAKALLTVNPACSFAELEAGKVYLCLGSYRAWENATSYRIHAVTPKRRAADVTRASRDEKPYRIHAGSHHGSKFHELTDDAQSLLSVAQPIRPVEYAVQHNLEVPPLVRRHYPHLFLTLPAPWTWEQFKGLIVPEWKRLPDPASLEQVIAQSHEWITKYRTWQSAAEVLSPDSNGDYEQKIAEEFGRIAFCRWFKPHVSLGGVFYLPVPQTTEGHP